MADVVASKIIIPVTTNAARADKDLTKLDGTLKDVNSTLGKTEKQAKKTASGFSNIKGLLISGGIIAAVKTFGAVSIKAASDAEETTNKFNVTFSSIQEEAKKTAEVLRDSFGLSTEESQRLLSSTGDLLSGFGFTQKSALELSNRVQTLAADLASFNNVQGGTQRASEIITKALLGERDALVSLSTKINEADIDARLAQKGFDKLTGAALRQEKALATLELITEQNKNAIGDYARSANSLANQLKRLQSRAKDVAVEFGKPLASSISVVIREFEELEKTISGFSGLLPDLGKNVNGVQIQFGSLASSISDAARNLVLFGAVSDQIKALRKDLDDAQKSTLGLTGTNITNFVTQFKNAQKQIKSTSRSAKKGIDVYQESLKILARSGDLTAQLKLQEQGFQKQLETVRKAGLDTNGLIKFQEQQRLNTVRQFLQKSVEGEKLSIEERQANLTAAYEQLLETDNLSYESRLEAQRVYSEQSAMLEQQRIESFATSVQQFGRVAGLAIGFGEAIAQARRNQLRQEIEDLKEKGATEAEIEAKEKELRKKAAQDQKRFGIASTLIDTAVGVANAFTIKPLFPLGLIVAGLVAARGAAQTAAIASTPIPAQFGGSFEVPPGNQADSGLLAVNQGERVDVTPVTESGEMPKRFILQVDNREINAWLVDRTNQNFNSGKILVTRKGAIKKAS